MTTTLDSNQLYSRIAKFYNFGLWLFGYKLAVDYFIRLIPFERETKLKVLDAGCGTGLYTFALLKRFPNILIHAFDLNVEMVRTMKNTIQQKGLGNQVKIFTGDVTKSLPFQQEQFDLIITGGVLEYVESPAVVVKNLFPYLKKGGYFLNSPVKDTWLGRMLAKLYKFKLHSSITNISAFTHNSFTLEGMRSLPIIKEAHLFKKI